MTGSHQKTLGAFIIGLALVFGTYTWVNFGKPRSTLPAGTNAAAPIRSAIAVTDNDNNGIEDWRDDFVKTEAVVIGQPAASYTPPTTITGKLGITFFEDFVRAKNYGPFGRTQEEIVTDTVNNLARNTEQILYGVGDLSVMETWTDSDIHTYGNAMGNIIISNNQRNLENEMVILSDILDNQKTERVAELEAIASVYKVMRDQSLALPVPKPFLKEHLDLINTYEAIHQDIQAMTLSLTDPAVALLRIRRYEDDALGLGIALENMYTTLEPYAALFSVNDPALIFANFNSSNLVQQ